MNKALLIAVGMFFIANVTQAFLVEEHCDDYQAFSISSRNSCEQICPNRKTIISGGSGGYDVACVSKKKYADANKSEEKCWDDLVRATTDIECLDGTLNEQENCVQYAIKEKKDVIYINGKSLQHLCDEASEYYNEIYSMWNGTTCAKKCPADKPLRGKEGDCYPCDTKYVVILSGKFGFSYRDADFKNVCPDRVIVGGDSYDKNIINSFNTIEKIQNIIESKEYKSKDYCITEPCMGYSLLSWNVILNQDPEIIKYLLEHDTRGKESLYYVLQIAIDQKVPESILKILLDYAEHDDLIVFVPRGWLYGIALEPAQEWGFNVPMSFYAKYAGASESTQKLIKSYEDKVGVDYEPIFEDMRD
ncbi:MAG: hypothetical protein IJS26_02870 [Alphaproteobacteria bacterium]|nr:hypothetical protein [Alphaproteobacteria bacterium]